MQNFRSSTICVRWWECTIKDVGLIVVDFIISLSLYFGSDSLCGIVSNPDFLFPPNFWL